MGVSASRAVRFGAVVLVSVQWRLRFSGSVRHVASSQSKQLLSFNGCVNLPGVIVGRVVGAQGMLAVGRILRRSQVRRFFGVGRVFVLRFFLLV